MKISRSIKIQATKEDLLNYFNSISENPDSYKFKSHKGIKKIEGNLDKPGSIFQTEEIFLFFKIRLTFEIIKVDKNNRFVFKLLDLFENLGVLGEFKYKQLKGKTQLELCIYQKESSFFKRVASSPIFLPPVSWIISRQLEKELNFIKKQIENRGC